MQDKALKTEDIEDIELENQDALEDLHYSEEEGAPIYSSVKVTKKDFSVYELHRRYENKKLILDVDFQRNSVWESTQKHELIESILMGLPLPIFYFKQMDNATYVVVDGKQRLTALFEFLENKYALKGLKILSFLNGKKFRDLVEKYGIYQTQLEDYQVYSHVILPPTPDKILFDIFDRVNRGGTKLNKQEIRNALYHGKGLERIDDITRAESFVKATRIKPARDRRMKGSYLLNRFFAFYFLFKGELGVEYNGDIDELLQKTLLHMNKLPDESLDELVKMTEGLLEKAYAVGGQGIFRKAMNQTNPINMNIFETTLYFLYLVKDSEKYADNTLLYERLFTLINDDEFLRSIADGRDGTVKMASRFKMVRAMSEGID